MDGSERATEREKERTSNAITCPCAIWNAHLVGQNWSWLVSGHTKWSEVERKSHSKQTSFIKSFLRSLWESIEVTVHKFRYKYTSHDRSMWCIVRFCRFFLRHLLLLPFDECEYTQCFFLSLHCVTKRNNPHPITPTRKEFVCFSSIFLLFFSFVVQFFFNFVLLCQLRIDIRVYASISREIKLWWWWMIFFMFFRNYRKFFVDSHFE